MELREMIERLKEIEKEVPEATVYLAFDECSIGATEFTIEIDNEELVLILPA